jgi:hypothetical protein
MLEHHAQDPALQFFYFGFYDALRRFRRLTISGWLVAAAGVAAVVLRWGPFWSGDLAALSLCGLLLASGLLLVHTSVSGLSAYVRVPFPAPERTEHAPAIAEILPLLKAVEEGGWQDALNAQKAVRGIGERYRLPPPDQHRT